jgi:GntR family transcriptional regulator
MLQLALDRSNRTPLHSQVAAEIRKAVADGEVGPGERLPPARDLAAVLGVNSNTVLRALRLLREEGVLDFKRGRGVTVADTSPNLDALLAATRELVELARSYGVSPAHLARIIRRLT